jgi:hypothetical protein
MVEVVEAVRTLSVLGNPNPNGMAGVGANRGTGRPDFRRGKVLDGVLPAVKQVGVAMFMTPFREPRICRPVVP